MAPKPETQGLENNEDDAVVISGMSGIFPGCENVVEFADKLYGKVNMAKIGDKRWEHFRHPECPTYQGNITDLKKFDAQFFMVHYKLANVMDCLSRKLMEQAYQAIFDAGISPAELWGKKVVVFAVTGQYESERCDNSKVNVALLGKCRSMAASRISYRFNLKGQSLVMDSACTSTVVAIQQAVNLIRDGLCEAAIICGGKSVYHPHSSIHYHRIIPNCSDGENKSYDANADGQSCSEAAATIFLQKYKDAKRVYASISGVMHVLPPGYGDFYEHYKTYRAPEELSTFLRNFYHETGVDPTLVEYVEGFGAAIPDVDKAELRAIENVFVKGRKGSLGVGSVASNIGHTEAVTAMCGLIKLLFAYQRGSIPANLHYKTPHDIPSIKEGKMQILTEDREFHRSYSAINCLAVTGNSGHIILKGLYKPKDSKKYFTDIPYLILAAGRQEEAVKRILKNFEEKPLDPEEIALIHNIHKIRVSGLMARGYGIYGHKEGNVTEKPEKLSEKADYYDDMQKPLWFVYSGMGSQWATMGAKLMALPIFAESIQRSHNILVPKGIDLIHVLTADDPTTYDNIVNSFVGIAAVQIALTDILRALGVVPTKIIGHSVGELGCAYGDGAMTAEEMILASYYRGLVSVETPFIRGAMAAVGLGYQKVSTMVPQGIEVACHNGPESCTISGPEEIMKEFVEKLTVQGIFAKEVPCSNIAYHSRYIRDAGPALLSYLKEIIKTPKLRSEKWLSTSVPQEKWEEETAKYSSAEYHTNNLLNPVLFEETSKLIPPNSVVVEIAPHGLLQAILKRSLPKSCTSTPLCQKNRRDGIVHLLEAIGNLYMAGVDVDVSSIYPRVEFPVSTETSTLSQLVEWAHVDTWNVCEYVPPKRVKSAVYNQVITTLRDEDLIGHVIQGHRVYPFAATLVAVWETLAGFLEKSKSEVPIEMTDVNLYLQPLLYNQRSIHVTVYLQIGSGRFEVMSGKNVIADGYIIEEKKKEKEWDHNEFPVHMSKTDVYKFLFERGYNYREPFRSIDGVNQSLTAASVEWNNDWAILIDGIFQLLTLRRGHNANSQLRHIKSLTINPSSTEGDCTKSIVIVDEIDKKTMTKNITMSYVSFVDKMTIVRQFLGTKALKFVPFFQEENVDMSRSLYIMLQIVAENLRKDHMDLYEISGEETITAVDKIRELINIDNNNTVNITRLTRDEFLKTKYMINNLDVVILYDLISDTQVLEALYHIMPADSFIITMGIETKGQYPPNLYNAVCSIGTGKMNIELAKWKPEPAKTSTYVTVQSSADHALLQGKFSRLNQNQELLVLCSYPPSHGLKDLIKHLRSNSKKDIKMVMINHKISKEQDVTKFSKLNLVYNILDHGVWGGEYYVPITSEKKGKDQTMKLHMSTVGDLNSLEWIEADNYSETGIDVKVSYAGLNVYDAKRARAEFPSKNTKEVGFGMDFSGTTESGERVMGLIQGGSVRTQVKALPGLLWPVPKYWSLEEAATVPMPYIQAFYCLVIKTKLLPGMKVLVHGGTGALGQAVISIALAMKCNVFSTVSTVQKKRFLKQLFPDLKAEHIGNSRDLTFCDMILTESKGYGCDIIISCVQGDLKHATLTCCAAAGHTVDVIQLPSQEYYQYGMYNMMKMRSYLLVDFTDIFAPENAAEMRKLHMMVSEGISRGYVRPLSRVIYSPHEASQALRLLAASRHRGRVLLKMSESMSSKKSLLISSFQSCHVVICDRDDFGVMWTQRLIEEGVEKLIFQCPNATSYIKHKIKFWEKQGIKVKLNTESLSNESILSLFNDANNMGPVEAIYILSSRTADGRTRMNLVSSIPNLDSSSRKLCLNIKYFAVISDNSNDSQQICRDRAQCGLPAMSLVIPDLKLFDEPANYYGSVTSLEWYGAQTLIEKALRSKEPVVLAYAHALLRPPVQQRLAEIPGLTISDSTTDDTKLEKIGVDAGLAQEVANELYQVYNVVVNKDKLPDMTIADLKTLERNQGEIDLQMEVTEFNAFINKIDYELDATLEFLHMETLVQTSYMRNDEFDMDLHYLYVVPGLESHYERFRTICEGLKIAAIVLQPGFDDCHETLDQTAQRLVDVMKKRLKVEDNFYLMGYEFGVLLVLKIAEILEGYGYTGKVFLIGGMPEDVQNNLQYYLHQLPSNFENHLVTHICKLMTDQPIPGFELELRATNKWDEKVDLCVKKLRMQAKHSSQYVRNAINTFYARINLLITEKFKPTAFRSQIICLRPVLPFPAAENVFYSLVRDIFIYELSATAPNAYLDQNCSNIINKHLNQDVLDLFKQKKHRATRISNYEYVSVE